MDNNAIHDTAGAEGADEAGKTEKLAYELWLARVAQSDRPTLTALKRSAN